MAKAIDFPVVMKVASPDIIHKSDVRGVALDIRSEKDFEDRYAKMMDYIGRQLPHARIIGVSIQHMIKQVDYEIILGTKKDHEFGSVDLFGTGGVTAEVFKDFSIGLPPSTRPLQAG